MTCFLIQQGQRVGFHSGIFMGTITAWDSSPVLYRTQQLASLVQYACHLSEVCTFTQEVAYT